MAFSRVKYRLYKTACNVTITRANKGLFQKTLKYDVNHMMSYKGHAYIIDERYVYFINGRAHAFYNEGDPYPKDMTQWYEVELADRSANLQALKESKIIQDIIKGAQMNMFILALVVLNIVMTIVIIAKLWGAFDK